MECMESQHEVVEEGADSEMLLPRGVSNAKLQSCFFRGVDCLSNLCVFPPWCERSVRIVTGISLAFYCCTCVLDEWARVDGSHNARSFPQGGGEIFSDDSSKQYFLSSLYMGSVIHVVLKNTSNTLFVSSHIGLFVRDFNKKLTMISTFVRCTF